MTRLGVDSGTYERLGWFVRTDWYRYLGQLHHGSKCTQATEGDDVPEHNGDF